MNTISRALALILSLLLVGTAAATDVVDSQGQCVGTYNFVPANGAGEAIASVVRKINGIWFQLPVFRAGFAPTSVSIGFTGPNCTGTPYIGGTGYCQNLEPPVVGSNDSYQQLVMDAATPGGCFASIFCSVAGGCAGEGGDTLVYPSGPATNATICSYSSLLSPPSQDCGNYSPCINNQQVYPLASFNLTTLSLVPPFRLQSSARSCHK